MTDGPICPVILAGGSGTRLWPVSRKARPKQFARLHGDRTLLSDTVRRLEDAGCGTPIYVTNEAYRWAVSAEAEDLGLVDHRIILEPVARNTAAAICAAAEVMFAERPDALLLITPSDHVISDALAFADAISRGAEAARGGDIVVFGIPPTSAETGYGYIEVGAGDLTSASVPYRSFVEKPDKDRAVEMVRSGRYLWNGGLFLASAATLRAAFQMHVPELAATVKAAVAGATTDLGFLRLGSEYGDAPSLPFDTAVMEHTRGTVVPMDAGWSDLGSWRGVWSTAGRDDVGCATIGAAHGIECTNALLMSSNPETRVVGVGLNNIAAVATRDAVLVVDMDRSQSVTDAVAVLKAEEAPQAEAFDREDRPWGYFETIARGPRFQVKSIVVKPGGALSLQSHVHRAEHWIVVEGTATVTVGDTNSLVTENQSVYIPLGTRHRLANQGKVSLRLIEVQTGAYLEEDDIVRFEDVYQRT